MVPALFVLSPVNLFQSSTVPGFSSLYVMCRHAEIFVKIKANGKEVQVLSSIVDSLC